MKQFLAALLLALSFVIFPQLGFAAESESDYPEVAGKFMESYTLTKSLFVEKDKAKQDTIIAQIKTASDNLEAEIAKIDADKDNTKVDRVRVAEIKKLWGEYRAARDSQIIPAYLSGDEKKLNELRNGPQNNRYVTLRAMLTKEDIEQKKKN